MTDLSMLSAAELVAGYRSGDFTPVDATRAALAAIEAHDPAVNAFVLVDDERGPGRGRGVGRALCRRAGRSGRATAIPTTIKDMFLTEGWPTPPGQRLDRHRRSLDETRRRWPGCARPGRCCWARRRRPSSRWKGVTDSRTFGATGNPWDPALHRGRFQRRLGGRGLRWAWAPGRSAPTAAARCGSRRRSPARSRLKPTYGLVPIFPPSPFGTLSHAGPMTRTVTDAAIMLDVAHPARRRGTGRRCRPRRGSFLDRTRARRRRACGSASRPTRLRPQRSRGRGAVRAAVDVLADAGRPGRGGRSGVRGPGRGVLRCSGSPERPRSSTPTDPGSSTTGSIRAAPRRRAAAPAPQRLGLSWTRPRSGCELGTADGRVPPRYDLLVTPDHAASPRSRSGRDAPPGWRRRAGPGGRRTPIRST